MDTGAWRATLHGITKSQTRLSNLAQPQITNPAIHLQSWLAVPQKEKVKMPSVQLSCSVMSDSLQPHGLQHGSLPCPSPTPRACWNSCPSSWWCHPTTSSSVIPLLLLLSIFPSIRVYSNESVFCNRWPKYWSFSFSISPSNDYSGLISIRVDWLDLLAVQVTLKRVFSNTTVQKHQFFGAQPSSQSNFHIHTWLLEKP